VIEKRAVAEAQRDQMNVVIVGHVDHGKSTVVGRLLADTGALPQGKLDAVRRECERTGKPFEYAFLLDALIDEQDQGITIDTARCFFKSATRDYIIIDAPGHIEFLKNMISGAARARPPCSSSTPRRACARTAGGTATCSRCLASGRSWCW
jgi:bifunctional enzyme CysN/CysC